MVFVIYEDTIPKNLLDDLNIDNDFVKHIYQIEKERYCTILGSESSRKKLYLNFCKYLRQKKKDNPKRNKYIIWYVEIEESTNWTEICKFIKVGGQDKRYFIIENCNRNDTYELLTMIKNHSDILKNEIILISSNKRLQYSNWYILELPASDEIIDATSFRQRLQNSEFENKINKLLKNRIYEESRIAMYIDNLIPINIKNEKFSQHDIFLLLYSIYLYDIIKSEKKTTSNEEIYNEIISHHDIYYLDKYEAKAIAEICCTKDKDIYAMDDNFDNFGIPSYDITIDLQFLTTIFLLGNTFDHIYKKFGNIIRYIDDKNPPKIQFQINPSSWNDLVKLTSLQEDVQSKLDKIKFILNKRNLPKYFITLDKKMQNIADKIKKNLRNNLKEELNHFHSQVEGWSYSAIQEEVGIRLKNLDYRLVESEEKSIGRGTYYLLFIYYPEYIGIHFEIMISVHENYDRIGVELHMEGADLYAYNDTEKFFEELYEEKENLGFGDYNFRRNYGKFRGLGEWIEGNFFKDGLDDDIVKTLTEYINKLKPIIDKKYFKNKNNEQIKHFESRDV